MDRLQEVKKLWEKENTLDLADFDWLIKNAIQQQEQNKLLTEQLDISHSLRDRDFKTLERYRKALEEISIYKGDFYSNEMAVIAGEALEGESNE